ncbi:MAG: SIS domain-containing protein [Candidatus Ratteibacteria bacterium]
MPEQQTMKNNLREYACRYTELCQELPYDDITCMVKILWDAAKNGKTIFTMGNGGHCNTASHMVNDLAKHTVSSDDKKKVVAGTRFKTLCLNDSMSFVTGIANDMGFDNIFAEQLENMVQRGDVVIGISGSGNSENVIRAFAVAKQKGATTICLAGFAGGKARTAATLCVVVPCDKMVMVEDFHMMIAHMVADELKKLVQKRKELTG